MKNRFAKLINSLSKKFGYRFIKIQKSDWSDNFIGISKFEKKILKIASNIR